MMVMLKSPQRTTSPGARLVSRLAASSATAVRAGVVHTTAPVGSGVSVHGLALMAISVVQVVVCFYREGRLPIGDIGKDVIGLPIASIKAVLLCTFGWRLFNYTWQRIFISEFIPHPQRNIPPHIIRKIPETV